MTFKVVTPQAMSTFGGDEHLWSELGLVRVADVQASKVRWIWPQRIPLGKLTELSGDPDVGKSTLVCDLVARLTTGAAMPDGTNADLSGPSVAFVFSAEDSIDDTIRPRLEAAGADLGLVYCFGNSLLQLPADIEKLRADIKQTDAKLVVFDPFVAFLDPRLKANRDQDVRRALTPLAEVAAETGTAVVLIRHLTKAETSKAIYRMGGSIGITGAVRSSLLAAADPDDSTSTNRLLATVKANLASFAPTMAYHVEEMPESSSRVVWDGVSQHTASSLLVGAGSTDRSAMAASSPASLHIIPTNFG
jgi:RecA-family ATPase